MSWPTDGLTRVLTSTYNDVIERDVWTQKFIMGLSEQVFWNRFAATTPGVMPIYAVAEAEGERGQIVKVDYFSALSGAGVTGVVALTGGEESMTAYQVDVTLAYLANAVAVHKADQYKTLHDLLAVASPALQVWLAGKMDDVAFDALDAQTVNRIYGGDATSTATIEAEDKLTPQLISRAKTKARALHIPTISVPGVGQFYVMVAHPYAAYDLKQDTTWAQAQREAGIRGQENPIFSGALGIWDGVVLFENDRVGRSASTSSYYSFAHLVGTNALAWVWGQAPGALSETRDYNRIKGVGVDAIYGCSAAVFNSTAIGHVPVVCSAVDPNA